MKPRRSALLVNSLRWLAALLVLPAATIHAEQVYCYKATVSLPVLRFATVAGKTKLETKTLKSNDIINIALGNPLGTTVGKMIVAVRSAEHPDAVGAPVPKLFIYDLDQQTIVKELASISSFSFGYIEPRTRGSGTLFGTVAFADTGMSSVGKFYAATFHLSAAGAGSAADPFNFRPSISASTTTVNGRCKFDFTDAKGTAGTFEGIIIGGKISASGKPVAVISE